MLGISTHSFITLFFSSNFLSKEKWTFKPSGSCIKGSLLAGLWIISIFHYRGRASESERQKERWIPWRWLVEVSLWLPSTTLVGRGETGPHHPPRGSWCLNRNRFLPCSHPHGSTSRFLKVAVKRKPGSSRPKPKSFFPTSSLPWSVGSLLLFLLLYWRRRKSMWILCSSPINTLPFLKKNKRWVLWSFA